MKTTKYELYHDESKIAGYWHGILLIPVAKKQFLLDELEAIRNNVKYTDVVSLKKVRKPNGKIFRIARSWIQLGVGALIHDFKNQKWPIYTGNTRMDLYSYLEQLIGAKFILFRERDNHKAMNATWFPDAAAKVETSLRMGIKGGLHLLGNSTQQIQITRMHFDGHQHHSGRHLDKSRIIDRLHGLREYCSFLSDTPDFIDDRCSDHKKQDSQSYADCQLLQLTDLLVSGFRTVLGQTTSAIHYEISKPLNMLATEYSRGFSRMKNSRWRDTLCLSQCYLKNGKWQFETLEPLSFNKKKNQQSLFDYFAQGEIE